jgi:surfactin synthase thioesterase subunit
VVIARKVRRSEDAATGTRDACATRNRLLLVGQFVVALNVISTLAAEAAQAPFNFAGAPFSPGSTVRTNVPLSAQEKSYAGQGGNPVPQSAVAVLATPANFDPRKSWPVLVPCSTSDFKRQNRDDLVQFYQRVGLAGGWVLLAGDGPQHARNDTAAWRLAMTLAAIDALHRSFAGSEKWPMACAGFSGGAKGAGSIAPVLARNGYRITGLYLTGVNQDYLSPGYARAQPGGDFLSTPIYVSAGHDDRIATLEQQYDVVGSIKRTGFKRVRIGTFRGGHEVNDAQTSIALRWFRELQK